MKKQMLYLSVYDPHVPYTGAGMRGGEFVTNLAKHFELDLVYLEGSGHSGNSELEQKFEWRVQGMRSMKKLPFSKKDYFIKSAALMNEAENLISKNKYDCVLCDYGLSAQYGVALKKKYNLPFIYCSHNIEFRQYLGKVKSDPRRALFIPHVYSVEKAGVKKSDILVPISEQDAAFYEKWTNRDKMVIIPQCFNPDIFNPNYEPAQNDPKIVLFFGNYNISTNREAVYVAHQKVVDKVVAKYPNVMFQFIGANPPTDINHPNMQFLGFVDDLSEYLKKADVMMSSIISGWGMPTKVVESLACGKPIVATEAAARAIPKKYKTLNVVEIDQFADKIVELLKESKPVDPVDFEMLKQEFTWEGAINKLAEKINHEI